MIVRPATAADLPRVLEMGRAFFGASPFAKLGRFDPDSTYATMAGLIADTQRDVLLAVDDAGLTVGMAGVAVTPLYFAPDVRLGNEVFWWVDPSARARGAGLALLEAVIAWARTHGATVLSLAHFHGGGLSDAGVVYREYGFDIFETAYARKVG